MELMLRYINKETNRCLVFENYTINPNGVICNVDRQIPRKWVYNEAGYAYVSLRDKSGAKHKIFIARAILSSFASYKHFMGANACFDDGNIHHLTLNNLSWLNDEDVADKAIAVRNHCYA